MHKNLLLNARFQRFPLKLLFRTNSLHGNSLEKRLEYYRNLNKLQKHDVNLKEWIGASSFESIPGPKPLPLVGNTWRFYLPKIGDFYGLDYLDIHRKLHLEYGDIAILKKIIGRQPLVLLFNPKDIEKLHQHDSVWPIRKGFPSVRHYRKLRTHLLPRSGLMTLEGEEWYKFRSVTNPVMLQPKYIIEYTKSVDTVTEDLIDNIRHFSSRNNEMPENFEYELYKWSLEAVGMVMMDNRFGCLKLNASTDSEPQKLMHSVLNVFDLMYKLDAMPGIWRIIPTPAWWKFQKNLDFVVKTSLKHIYRRLAEFENQKFYEKSTKSVLLKLSTLDREVAVSWSTEMILAGVDTTAKVLAAALYFLSKNPQVQEKLRTEAFDLLPDKTSPVTEEVLSTAIYTKAVIKETTRLAPITVGTLRVTKKNLVLGGYQVPEGIHVQTSTLLLSKKDEHFPRAVEFLPERWLPQTSGPLSYKNTNQFVFAPFGYGSRTCIGKRLANLELQIALLKVMRNFQLSWPHEDMVFKTNTLHGIAKPLKLYVKEI